MPAQSGGYAGNPIGQAAVQVGFTAVLVNADHVALEHREHVLDCVGIPWPNASPRRASRIRATRDGVKAA